MIRTRPLATITLATTLLGAGLTAASAQTFTVVGSVTGAAPTLTYSYLVTPTAGSLGLVAFNFSDANVTAGTTPAGFTNITPTSMGSGLFEFFSTAAGGTLTATTFTFTSPDAAGGTLGATNLSSAVGSSGTASLNGITPAPAPEPSQTAALGLGILGLTGLALKARKRHAVA